MGLEWVAAERRGLAQLELYVCDKTCQAQWMHERSNSNGPLLRRLCNRELAGIQSDFHGGYFFSLPFDFTFVFSFG
jgi:hypothetical protein